MSELQTLITYVNDLQDDVTVIVTRYNEVLNATENVVLNVETEIQKAADWATTPEDVLVPSGNLVDEYSALHWAAKAQEDAASTQDASNDAAAAYSSAIAAQDSEDNAAQSASAAENDRLAAQGAATTVSGQVATATDLAAQVSLDADAVAADAAQVNTDKGIVAADKSTVASSLSIAQGHENAALGYANQANTQALLAESWASAPEDTEVSTGFFSAYHYMKKCEQIESGLDINNKLDIDAQAADSALLGGQTPAYYRAWGNLTDVPSSFVPEAHTHSEVDILGLDKYTQAEVDSLIGAKADVTSVYTQAQLDSFLGGKTNVGHGHAIADIAGLLDALDDRYTISAAQSYIAGELSNLIDTAPGTLDTLNELAAALGDDPDFAATISGEIGAKLNASTWNSSAASGITGTQVGNWDSAYNWGNHASEGYLTSVGIGDVSGLQTALDGKLNASTWNSSAASGIIGTQVGNWDSAYNWGDHALAGYAVSADLNISNWDTAHGWGNHASAGYDETEYLYNPVSASLIRSKRYTVIQNWSRNDVIYDLSDSSWQQGDIVTISSVQGDKTSLTASRIHLPDGSNDTEVFIEQVGRITLARYTGAAGYWMVLT